MKSIKAHRLFLPFFVAITYIFLYAPILVLVIFSFNEVAFPYRWVGFSLRWYYELWQSAEIWQAAINSFIVATTSMLLSLMLALLWVFFGTQSKMRSFDRLFYVNLIIPEIILALGLLTLYTFFTIPLGLITLIGGHTVLGLGYAVPLLAARFEELDYSIIEVSFDLGATVMQTFWRVIMPTMMSTLVAAGFLVFIISLDDFLVSFFCAGSNAQTLSLYIFAMIRSGVSPVINALSTLLLLISSTVVLVFSFMKVRTKIF